MFEILNMQFCRKEDAGTKTAKMRDEKEILDRQLHADVEAKRNFDGNIQQMEYRVQELCSQEDQMQARLHKIHEASGKNTKELTRVRKELPEIRAKKLKSRFFLCIRLFFFII